MVIDIKKIAKIDAIIIFGTSKMEYINVNLTVYCHTEYTSMCLVSDLIVSMSREELYFFYSRHFVQENLRK
jgi:hypothetical protein